MMTMPMENSSGGSGTQSVERALRILRIVASLQSRNATLATIVKLAGLNRTTTFRLLKCLVEERMLELDGTGHNYRIGRLAVELGFAGGGLDHLARDWRDMVKRIARRTEMTTYLVARSAVEVVCLESVQAETVLRAVPLVPGQRLPLGIGAGSLAILSSLSDQEIDSVLLENATLRNHRGGTRLSGETLLNRVKATRENGYSYSEGSVAEGIVGLGMVLPGGDPLTQLAVSVSSVAKSLDLARRETIAAVLKEEIARAREQAESRAA